MSDNMIGKTISHYKIIEKLGGGGMGVVYKAQDTNLDRTVALKFLPPHMLTHKEAEQRFISEAKSASSFDHPNICTIYDINKTEDGQFYIVMGYYTGETLKKKLDAGPLQIDTAINYATQIATGLSRAHEAGIIHRDIKPANIMITERDEVKILDFGLAKTSSEPSLTKLGSTVGTVSYMSPEQTKGTSVDHRTDIWSLGIVLYQMLTGSLPFQGDYEQAIIYSILNEEPALLNTLPKDLEVILNKSLQKNPDDRYDNLNEMLDDLKKLKRDDAHQTIVDKPGRKRKQQAYIVSSIVGLILAFMLVYFLFIKDSISGESSAERKMLVVLPFKNLGLQADEYFADGITEEITSRLSKIKQLGIIGRTSADLYKNTEKSIDQIGEELSVDYLLEGAVRWEKREGEESRVRVSPQLIKVSDGTHLWTERYDAVLQSVFDVQTDIAEKVAQALNLTLLSPQKGTSTNRLTSDMAAYDFYLRGSDYNERGYSAENFKIAEQMFEKCIELDSEFALAYTKLATINFQFYWFFWDRSEERLTRAKQYIDKAKEINSDLPEVFLAYGQYYYHGYLDYESALIQFERGLQLRPGDGDILRYIGFVKRRQGKFQETIELLSKSLELDPLNQVLSFEIGQTYILLGNYEKAEHYLDKAIKNAPDWGDPYSVKARLQLLKNGDVNKAYRILKESSEIVKIESEPNLLALVKVQIIAGNLQEAIDNLSKDNLVVMESQREFVPKALLLGNIYDLQNNSSLKEFFYDSAKVVIEETIKELPEDARLYSALGMVMAELGHKSEAINNGKRAVELLPIEKDWIDGWDRELDLAKIYTIVGEYESAIQKLDYLLSICGDLSVPYIKIDMKEVLKKYQ
jgi:non-specific serine/threonine protein kinase